VSGLPTDQFHGTLRRRAPIVLLTTVLVALAAGLWAHASAVRYVSTTSILVGPVSSDVDTLRASQSLTSTYSQLILRPEATQRIATRLQLAPSQIADASDVTFNTDTRIVTLTVTTARARRSINIASGLTTQLTRLIGTIDPTAPGVAQVLSAQPQDAVAVTRSWPRYALLGGAGWLLLVLGVTAALAAGKSTEQTGEGLAAVSSLPVGTLPVDAEASRLQPADIDLIAEKVNRLRTISPDDGPNAARG
jgi:capsular polysaccharide biosynthesis protein